MQERGHGSGAATVFAQDRHRIGKGAGQDDRETTPDTHGTRGSLTVMKRLALFCVLLLVSTGAFAAQPATANGFVIRSIEAHLYHHMTGDFDPRDLVAPNTLVENVRSGTDEGQPRSSAVLVLVNVEGAFNSMSAHPPAVELFATAGGKTLNRTKVESSMFLNDQGKTRVAVPFLIYGIDCDKVDLVATLSGPGQPPQNLNKQLQLNCRMLD